MTRIWKVYLLYNVCTCFQNSLILIKTLATLQIECRKQIISCICDYAGTRLRVAHWWCKMTNTVKRHCCKFWRGIAILMKKFCPVLMAQVIGWAMFSYIEDDINVIDCYANPQKIANKLQLLVSEAELAVMISNKAAIKAGQNMTKSQSIEIYSLFKEYFEVPDQVDSGCHKWSRFATLTATTIGDLIFFVL